jgi:hypothetical protein
MKFRYYILFAIIGLDLIWLLAWFNAYGLRVKALTEGETLIFIVVFLSALFSLIYLKFGDKKIKCLKCSNLMWKDAHRCASCHWDYTYSYYESYESWDDFSKRNCLIKSLPCNAIKTYIVSFLFPFVFLFLVGFLFKSIFDWESNQEWSLKEAYFEGLMFVFGLLGRYPGSDPIVDSYQRLFIYSFLSVGFFLTITGIFFRDVRVNSWSQINEKE